MLTVAFYYRNRQRRDLPPPPLHSWSRNHPHEAPPADADAACAALRGWRRPPPSPPPVLRKFGGMEFVASVLLLLQGPPCTKCALFPKMAAIDLRPSLSSVSLRS
jgi:hypothetical protein